MTTPVDRSDLRRRRAAPLQPLALPEHAHVRLSVETLPEDADRTAWLAESERRLREVWENDADDVFNELLTR